MKKLNVDGQVVSFKKFMQVNTQEKDVEHLHPNDVERINKLEIGQSWHVGIGGGWTQIRRVK